MTYMLSRGALVRPRTGPWTHVHYVIVDWTDQLPGGRTYQAERTVAFEVGPRALYATADELVELTSHGAQVQRAARAVRTYLDGRATQVLRSTDVIDIAPHAHAGELTLLTVADLETLVAWALGPPEPRARTDRKE